MTGRSVPEWIGKSPDSKVPVLVRLRVFAAYDGRCHLSGRKIKPGDAWDLDHIKALWDDGEHRETNLAPALKDKHREKSAAENSQQADADRIRAKHLGMWPASRFKIAKRPFESRRGRS